MRIIILCILLPIVCVSFMDEAEKTYEINKDNIEKLRSLPLIQSDLKEVVSKNDFYANKDRNTSNKEAIIEHHLVEEIKSEHLTTYLIFEYFSLEGLSCNLSALTLGQNKEVKSIVRLANYEEYPDGTRFEFSNLKGSVLTKTDVFNGLSGYDIESDTYFLAIDTTIVRYKFENYKIVEKNDSLVKRHLFSE